jgi:hypothetical protein
MTRQFRAVIADMVTEYDCHVLADLRKHSAVQIQKSFAIFVHTKSVDGGHLLSISPQPHNRSANLPLSYRK